MAHAREALMSYSFTVKASSREKAKAMVAAKLDEVDAHDPAHRADREQALAAASGYIDICLEPGADQHMTVAMHGTLTWGEAEGADEVTAVGVSIRVGTFANADGESPA